MQSECSLYLMFISLVTHILFSNGPLTVNGHMVQKHLVGEQAVGTSWDILGHPKQTKVLYFGWGE